jgi:cytochrome P450
MFGIPEAMLSTVAHDLHRQRRAPIAPFFSQQAIRRFDPVIRKKLSILVSRLEEYERTEQPVDLEAAFTALTTDIISEYAFGISYGHLEADSFNPDWLKLLMGASENSHLEKQMPWLTKLMRKVPMSLLLKIKPQMGHFVVFQDVSSYASNIFIIMN